MFCHVLLGLLRDGTPRHGYDLVTEYRARSGNHVNPGNVYRELVRLTKADFVQTSVNPPDADPRRIPYQITQRGCHEFDRWLVAPATQDEELSGWLIFLDRLEPEMRDELLNRRQEKLWLRNKLLARAREDALGAADSGDGPVTPYRSLPALIARHMKLVAAELEFLDEFRTELAEHPDGATANENRSASPAPSGPLSRTKRKKGVTLP